MPDVIEQLEQYGAAVEVAAQAGSVVDPVVDPVVDLRSRRLGSRALVVAAAIALVVVAIAATLVVRAGNDAPGGLSTGAAGVAVPDGWTLIEDRDAGLRISVPESWARLDTVEPRSSGAPREVLTVGTEPLERTGVLAACPGAVDGLQAVDGAGMWVSLFEYPSDAVGPDYVMPTGEAASDLRFIMRPLDFAAVPFGVGTCPGSEPPAGFTFLFFEDGGRRFAVRIVAVGSSGPPDFALGYQVLDTLGVTPTGGGAVVTTLPTPATTATSVPTPPSTAAAGGGVDDPATEATPEAAARQVFQTWLNAGDRDAMDDVIEDYAAIGDAHRAGIAQHTAGDLALYSGRVEAVRALDDTHVSVTYTVLHGGRPAYANQAGIAVKVDGRWLVSRETVCALLGYGGISCPPRT